MTTVKSFEGIFLPNFAMWLAKSASVKSPAFAAVHAYAAAKAVTIASFPTRISHAGSCEDFPKKLRLVLPLVSCMLLRWRSMWQQVFNYAVAKKSRRIRFRSGKQNHDPPVCEGKRELQLILLHGSPLSEEGD